jgi:hypothetical protein
MPSAESKRAGGNPHSSCRKAELRGKTAKEAAVKPVVEQGETEGPE